MKPVAVGVHVEQPCAEVFAFLDVLANHEQFTDHMLTDWTCDPAATGVGARARMRANVPGPEDWIEMEVLAVDAPESIVEEAVGANGRRRTRGTYTLSALPGGGTDVRFELAYLEAPLPERLAAPLLRLWLKRANAKAMLRLRDTLSTRRGV
jgi:uncharacterized protein YndB with AHSA1/START domain